MSDLACVRFAENPEKLHLMDASAFIDTSGRLETAGGWMFNPTVGVCQSGRPEQQADFDGLGSKENTPGMLGTSLSRLESSVPLKSCPSDRLPSLFQFLSHSTPLGLPGPDHRTTRAPGG